MQSALDSVSGLANPQPFVALRANQDPVLALKAIPISSNALFNRRFWMR